MLGKLLLLFAFIIFCSGCSTLSTPEESGKHTASTIPTAKSAQAQNIRFSPTYKSDETDKYYDAIEIYDSSPKASQGIYLYEGLVFVIVCIDTNKENIEYLEGTAMLRTADLLRKHYPGLPYQFRIRNRIVEKTYDYDSGIYRYATVYREKDIERKIKK